MKGNPVPGRRTLRGPQYCRVYVQIAPSLTSPTHVAPRKTRTTSVYRSSDSRSRIVALLGLALACLTGKPKPLLLLKKFSRPSVRLSEASPTLAHSSRISFVHAVRSLKRCSLLCPPLSRHQQVSFGGPSPKKRSPKSRDRYSCSRVAEDGWSTARYTGRIIAMRDAIGWAHR